jgi:CRISPR-associated protein Cmr1
METLKARFRIVTPMFISGADQTKAELRVPSIKGALRFWWRALAFARLNGDMAALRSEESTLFGSTSGQSSVLMKLRCSQLDSIQKGAEYGRLRTRPGALYLGYGVVEPFDGQRTRAGRLIRPCLTEAQEFDILVRGSRETLVIVADAFKALGLLGGLGSKARKGYGSLTLTSLSQEDEPIYGRPTNSQGYRAALRELISDSKSLVAVPPFSAFSTVARIHWLVAHNDSIGVLDEIGCAQQRYRSWGKNGKVNGKPSEKNFKEDHDWGKLITRPKGFHPKRVVFGLPHNYGKGAELEVTPGSKEHDRRASPMFLHVQDLGNGTYAGIASLLYAEFLPPGEKINAGGVEVPQSADYSILTNWLEGGGPLASPKPYFPNRETLWP